MARTFEQVQVGQKGSLKELEHGFEFLPLAAEEVGAVVTEVTPDYLVLEDASAGVTTRVPMYLIKAVLTSAAATAAAPQALPTEASPTIPEPLPAAA